jgi:ribosomal protein S18 acetylase RimI-like enzyme
MAPIATLDADAFAAALPELLSIYAAAMNYSPVVAQARLPLWMDHSRRIGFRCVVALAPGAGDDADPGTIAGFGYGYRGAIGQWWFGEVARGLGSPDNAWLADYFELTELHVRPTFQGHGIGESLLRALVAPAPNRTVLLSTPEGENRAWRLYRRLGFESVLRDFLFSGDSRPFAVLGRSLPLGA